jgi:coatomer subunit beta
MNLYINLNSNDICLFLSLSVSKKAEARPPLRQYMMDGDFFIGAALGTTLAKLALRYMSLVSDNKKQNRFCSEAMLIMASVLHLGKSGK